MYGHNKKKILIAEDEKPMARALQLKLQREDFDVDVVYDGLAAIERIDQGEIDLIILDLMMPKADGFSVLSHMKKKNILIPVIVASNLSQIEDLKRAQDLGAKEYFVKSNTALTEIIEKVKSLIY